MTRFAFNKRKGRWVKVKVIALREEPTIRFAAEELKKYLDKMLVPESEAVIQLGLFEDFDVLKADSLKWLSDVPDKDYDDAVYISVKSGRGIIAGINPRSVLLAVYRFLSDSGCRWLRPGRDGEYIPRVSLEDLSSETAEKPSYRHRGICIEGANSYENIKNIIDWAPKLGFNSYFFQFREAFTFFNRWYSHENNPLKEPEPFTVEDARRYVAMGAKGLEKRGMLHHAVGHGWTCEPFGIPGLEWKAEETEISDDIRIMLAEVNGKRELWHGVALNTNLCYSNEKARKTVTEAIADYLTEHPEVDVLHFWLADGTNNQCECENCSQTRPSDYYVMMLNELDELLTKREIERKIVFLIYVDLLWPPERERIKNPDRFIMMFAPISRTYNSAFDTKNPILPLPPYIRNKCTFPTSVEGNLAFLKAWQELFQGDSFDFDYHFMWAHFRDPGYYNIADILHKDIQNLVNIGLNGFISCQTQRAFFPTGLGMYTMGKTLWNRDLDFDSIKEEYFSAAYGKDGSLVSEYLRKLSVLFLTVRTMHEDNADRGKVEKGISEIKTAIADFAPVIDRNLAAEDKCIRDSWEYLKVHKEICSNMADIYRAALEGDKKKAAEIWDKTKRLVQEKEDELQTVLDVYLFIVTLGIDFDSLISKI
jgi:hypothetical protein